METGLGADTELNPKPANPVPMKGGGVMKEEELSDEEELTVFLSKMVKHLYSFIEERDLSSEFVKWMIESRNEAIIDLVGIGSVMKRLTEEAKPFSCPECGRGYKAERDFVRHMEAEHNCSKPSHWTKDEYVQWLLEDPKGAEG